VQDIQQSMKKANLTFSQVYKPDPNKPDVIRIEGTSPAQSDAVNTLLQGNKYANEYDLSGGPNNTWTLTMKPIYESDLDKRTVDQAIETIRDRVASAT
jgi:preprotein translocase subunit SecD